MRHPLVEAFEFCCDKKNDEKLDAEKTDITTLAVIASFDRYLINLFDQLAEIDENENFGVSFDRIASICDFLNLRLLSSPKNRSVYNQDQFRTFFIQNLTSNRKVRKIDFNDLVDNMIRKDECQWRMLDAVNRRLPEKTKLKEKAISVQMREVEIENLTRELIMKNAKIEALEKFSKRLCKKLCDMDSYRLVSKIVDVCGDTKTPKRKSRTHSRKSKSRLEETNKNLNEKLNKIAGDLNGVRNILIKVQPSVEKLERMAVDGEERKECGEERKASVSSCNEKVDEKIETKNGRSNSIQGTMCDSVSDSGCMSDEEMGEEMTNSQISESALIKHSVESRPLLVKSTCTIQPTGMEAARNVRQRLQEVSKRLRDTESRLAQLNRVTSPKRDTDGQMTVLSVSCNWKNLNTE